MAASDTDMPLASPEIAPQAFASRNGISMEVEKDEDDDDALPTRKRAARQNNTALEESDEEQGGADLFGDEPDEDADVADVRRLDDEDLDSGDDEDRKDRVASATPPAEPEQQREELVQYSEFGRQPVPEPSDGEASSCVYVASMYLLKVPNFLSIEPTSFDTPSFRVPEREHHSRQEPPSTFSAFNTATSTIRWRRSPSDSEELQSNARILRWSDGSLTMQFASDPTQQYEIDGNALAPPQKSALKPTPVSNKPVSKTSNQETYTYLTVPHESVGLLRVTHKITAGLSIKPSQQTTDDALVKLKNSLAAAVRGKTAHEGTGIEIMPVSEDPELGRKKAELAEKEKARAQKRREAAENRERDRGARALGRAGLGGSRGYGGGLSVGMLEDEDGAGSSQPKAKRPAATNKRRQRRNDEYSSDEDMGRRKGNFAQDEYEVDDFVAGSDEEEEEEEEAEASEEEEEELEEEPEERRRSGGGSGEKRSRPAASAEEEEEDGENGDGAEGEDEDDAGVRAAAPKAKRRRAVIDEDEDDE